MARKRRVKRASSKVVPSNSKIHLALNNMIWFGLLFAVSLGVYNWVKSDILMNTFGIISLITGVIALAFLVAYLILVFMKWFKQ